MRSETAPEFAEPLLPAAIFPAGTEEAEFPPPHAAKASAAIATAPKYGNKRDLMERYSPCVINRDLII
jgi:hypothetical protein